MYVSSIGVALGKMSQWAAEYGTGEDLWHLLTVCYIFSPAGPCLCADPDDHI